MPPSPLSSISKVNDQSASDKQVLIEWDSDIDPDNPHNWPVGYKVIILLITVMSAWIYMAAAIYLPSMEHLPKDIQLSKLMATFPLTFFTLRYGVGPMCFSPMSENPRFGRTIIYVTLLFMFFI